MIAKRRLVIVGAGMAGARLAEHVRARESNPSHTIVVFGDEPGGTYNRILLSGVLAGTHAGPDIVTNPVEWYRDNGIVLHHEQVDRIDLHARCVVGARGTCEPFDALVLATGSSPIIPGVDGLSDRDGTLRRGVFVFRTVDDCARIAVAASEARTAVVLGGGLLGLEAARGLMGHGLDVTVVHLAGHVMNAQLDPAGGQVVERQLERLGIRVLSSRTTTRIHADSAVRAVELDDGSVVDCDLVVIAAGVRPNIELARAAGLRVNRGIVVGDDLSCEGVRDVYAIGDCVEHRGQVYGLVAPAWEQADVLADRLAGRDRDAVYQGSRLATKLKVAGLSVAVMGDRDPLDDDEIVSYAEPSRGIYNRLILRDDRIAGAVLIGAPDAAPSIVQRYLDSARVPDERSELLFPPSGPAPTRSVDEIPDTARICDCNAISKEQIVAAVLNGARSVRAVCERTRAGTGCGSCKPEVQRIVDHVCADLESAGAVNATGPDHAGASGGGDHVEA